jgi:hypothetical protein
MFGSDVIGLVSTSGLTAVAHGDRVGAFCFWNVSPSAKHLQMAAALDEDDPHVFESTAAALWPPVRRWKRQHADGGET